MAWEIDYVKDGAVHAIRVDGAPASADFQGFLTDLGAAARAPDRALRAARS